MRAGKDLLSELSPAEAALFMQLTQLPALITSILGLGSRFPAFSTVVSNVPGPRRRLYWYGARLDGIYPASIVFDGFAMNITLVSYCDKLDFGIVACRRSLPQIQRIIDHLEDALQELEAVAGIGRAGKARSKALARRKTVKPTSKTAGARPRTKPKAQPGTGTRKQAQPAGRKKAAPKKKATTGKKQAAVKARKAPRQKRSPAGTASGGARAGRAAGRKAAGA
jgi:diacylglycerol O-acyltransferase